MAKRTGTKEWSDSSLNIQTGCSHNCKYCYAAAQAARFGRREAGDWAREEIQEGIYKKRFGKRKGRIMFPTAHDITENNVGLCGEVIKKLIAAENEVLIVSKPSLSVIKNLCEDLDFWIPAKARFSQLTFRFTIGSMFPGVLKFWEPGAPTFVDRLRALVYAYENGWQTSVSIEPMLDQAFHRTVALVETVEPYVTDTIWIGVMNHAEARLSLNGHRESTSQYLAMDRALRLVIRDGDEIFCLYNELKDNPKVRWKDSIKTMLCLPEEDVG